MVESYGKNGNTESLRQRVFALLDENPCLTAKPLCELLGLQYAQSYRYLNKLKSEWKSNRENEQGSKCSSVHGWRGSCCVPCFVSRDLAVEVGWGRTRARNSWLLWRDKIGRLMWFESGRVNVYVRGSGNEGRVKQLISNGFFNTGLIFEFRILEQVFKTFKFKGAHHVFDSGSSLPKMTIDAFEKSHGVVIKTGDKSHPRAIEVISSCPDWAERCELLMEKFRDFLDVVPTSKGSLKKPDYVVLPLESSNTQIRD